MSKKDLLKVLDNSSYCSLIAGAILVLVFQLTASIVVFRLAIILFGAAFLILCVMCSMKLYFMKHETKENEELVVDKTKDSKKWIIIRLVFSAVCFALMITFLCLF